jgi:hypothetical protein
MPHGVRGKERILGAASRGCPEGRAPMKVRIIRQHATGQELADMLEALGTYIRLAVDVGRGILAGGGEYHADCEEVLLEDGSVQEQVWGADWYPDSRSVLFGALINIRPRQGNMGMEIQDIRLREQVEAVVRNLLGG